MSQSKQRIPDADAINASLALSKYSLELANYCRDRLINILASHKLLSSSETLLDKINKFCDQRRRTEEEPKGHWKGAYPKTDFQCDQRALATGAADHLIQTNFHENLVLVFAIKDETTSILRAYLKDGQLISPNDTTQSRILDALDKLFNAWLAEKGYLTKNGEIYLVQSNGDVIKDSAGKPKKANAQQIKELLASNDYIQYLSQKKINLTAINEQGAAKPTLEDKIIPTTTDAPTIAANSAKTQGAP